MSDLGTLSVGFEVDVNSLSSGFDTAKSQASSAASAVADAADQIDTSLAGTGDAASSFAEMFRMAAENMAGALDLPIEQVAAMQAATEEAASGIVDSNGMALASYDELASGGEAAGSSLIEVLLNISENIKDVQYAVEAMSSETTGAIEDLGAEFGNVGEQAQAAGEAVAEAGASASEASGGGFLDLFNQVGIGIFNIQNYINIAKQLAGALLGPAQSAETVTSALTTLDGSAAAASREMDQLNQFASKTPFKTLDIDTAAEQLQGFGINASNVIPEITAIGDALGSVGRDTPAELDSVVQIFGKIHTEGKITQATMNELAIHGINGWQALADATGKTIPQVKALVAQGLLPADDAINDLTKGIEKNPLYAGGMAKAAGTFTGLLSTLQSNWDQMVAAFGTPIIKALEGSLNDLGNELASPSFQQFAGAVGQGIVTVFQDIGGAVQQAFTLLQPLGGVLQEAGSIGAKAWKDVSDILFQVGGVFRPVSDAFASFSSGSGQAFSDFVGNLHGLLQEAGQAFHGLAIDIEKELSTVNLRPFLESLEGLVSNKNVTSFLGSLKDGFSQVQKIVGGQLGQDFQFFGQTIQQIGKWFQADMIPAIKAAEPGFEHLASAVGTTLVPALAGLWADGQKLSREVLPPLIKAFETAEPIIVKVGGFIADNLGAAIQFLTPYIMQAVGAITQFAGEIIQRVEPIVQNLWKDIQDGIDFILPIWNAVWPGMKETLQGLWEEIVGVVKVAWALLSGIVKVGLDLLSGNWAGAWKDIQDTFQGVWDGIQTFFGGVWDSIKGAASEGINFVIAVINDFINGLDQLHITLPNGVSIGFSIPDIPYVGFASGGYAQPNSPFVAGEDGPELIFSGSQGATVLNHSQSLALVAGANARGSASSGPIHIHVHLGAQEIGEWMVDSVGNAMVSRIRAQGPVGRVA